MAENSSHAVGEENTRDGEDRLERRQRHPLEAERGRPFRVETKRQIGGPGPGIAAGTRY
jgi:hypothetical protein